MARLRLRRTRPDGDAPVAAVDGNGEDQADRILSGLDDLRDMPVHEIMTPRVDVVGLPIPVTAADLARAVRQTGHSTFPVYDDDLDKLVGVLYARDLFRAGWEAGRAGDSAAGATDGGGPGPAEDVAAAVGAVTPAGPARDAAAPVGVAAPSGPAVEPAVPAGLDGAGAAADGAPGWDEGASDTGAGALSPLDISRRIRKPYIVPESRLVLDVLASMRRDRRAFAVVVDEYGGVAGIVTIKDLLAALVGDLRDEFDRGGEPDVIRVDRARWLVDGGASVDELRDQLGAPIPEGEYVTLGGFLLDVTGHIPEEGEQVTCGSWEYRVVEMDKRRVAKVVLRSLDGEAADAP